MPVLIVVGLLLSVFVIFFGVHYASDYLDKTTASPKVAACSNTLVNHVVVIKNDKLSTTHTYAQLCDTLTIVNQDDKLREIGFGEHDHHQQYDGVFERNLEQGQQFTVTLNKTGTYKFHDHFQGEVNGQFTVN